MRNLKHRKTLRSCAAKKSQELGRLKDKIGQLLRDSKDVINASWFAAQERI